MQHTDVLIIGAGISGISSAFHLMKHCPDKSFALIEGRGDIGGTWDLFRYPGIRSDSDMYTLGFSFRPWRNAKAIADAPSIMEYLRGAVDDGGFADKIHFNKKMVRAAWLGSKAKWVLTLRDSQTGEEEQRSCSFLHMCAGYYNYDQGYRPQFADEEAFDGQIVHPQFWPEDLDYEGKKVVIVGSGATAVTLVPAMARKAEHVTMLQRSPTYIVARPAEDAIANFLRACLPRKWAYGLTRWKNILLGRWFFWYCRAKPEQAKQRILDEVRKQVPEGFDVERHLTPNYNPWDQRLCLAPDADFFTSLHKGKSTIVTDHIERFTKNGIELKSGEKLKADIIVTATGLDLNFFGNAEIMVDNRLVKSGDLLNYKGMMFSGIPNMLSSFGYTNASWTLRCDLTSAYLCRLLKYMDKKNYDEVTPTVDADNIELDPLLDFSSGYITRKYDELPKQGKQDPWRMYQNYIKDIFLVKYGSVADDGLVFHRRDNNGDSADMAGLTDAANPSANPVEAPKAA